MSLDKTIAELQPKIGQEIYLSDWLPITQELVDRFAEATGDYQWIHTDPERAAAESPFKSTIAHGYLTLSLYPMMRGLVDEAVALYPGVKNVINYGLNRLRFTNAVRVGSRIRLRCKLLAADEVKGSLQLTEDVSIEIDGETRPACVAECIMRLYF